MRPTLFRLSQLCTKNLHTSLRRNYHINFSSIRKHLSKTPKSYYTTTISQPPIASKPVVGYWLLGCSALVFGIVVVGGLTRLTESGLSIVEWNVVTGIKPPITQAEWEEEFEKYKQYPEYQLLNRHMTLEEFKFIFYMEWGHRILGRLIGVSFVLPAIYFYSKGYMSPSVAKKSLGIATLIGFQGFLGWYMVKSGLSDELFQPNSTPRVSQYRLAAHLGSAFLIYSAMVSTGISILRNRSNLKTSVQTQPSFQKSLGKFKSFSKLTTGLIFLTAISGAFVAGLDAGLLYNTFPLMGGRWIPPLTELFSKDFSDPEDPDKGVWRNIFENPTTTQFNHRLLGTVTFLATSGLFLYSRRLKLPKGARIAVNSLLGMALIQVTLGITTLVYLVPIPVAATHQAGSLTLLTIALSLLHQLKRIPK